MGRNGRLHSANSTVPPMVSRQSTVRESSRVITYSHRNLASLQSSGPISMNDQFNQVIQEMGAANPGIADEKNKIRGHSRINSVSSTKPCSVATRPQTSAGQSVRLLQKQRDRRLGSACQNANRRIAQKA